MFNSEFITKQNKTNSLRRVLAGPMLCLACSTASAQFTFTEKSATPFPGVDNSSIAFADVNKDGHQDVLITGQNNEDNSISSFYLNDGEGGFKLKATPFAGVSSSSIAFADVDGKNGPDVLITGYTGIERIAKLYVNDGSGDFTEKMETPFAGVSAGSIAFADVDGENGPDVLITGGIISTETIASLYLNEGEGNFTEKTAGVSFVDVVFSSIAFADVDKDGHQDVLITGQNNSDSGNRAASLYLNDGSGGFTLKATPFPGVSSGSIAFADVNRDGNEDVLITGWIFASGERISSLYLNDGSGVFTEKAETPFTGVRDGSIAFADVDGDGDQDVLITGNTGPKRIANLYLNDGSGGFTLKTTPFSGVNNSSIAFADVDGDDDPDVLITGDTGSGRIAKLYINDQAPVFSSGNSASVPENTTAVLIVTADDDSETLTYSVSGGADRSLFSINRSSGALTFSTAPDFEATGSDAGNNTYVVEVTASDGVNEGVSQTITITVTDENEAPMFANSGVTFSIGEDVAVNANVGAAVAATDPDEDGVTYTLTGEDSGDFS
ncbi:MAG: VCBS repeat-containing protein, partial [Ekhidna sp.]|nr:VCBS repeat-containing protein [Ekhidna sp.]